MLPFIILLFFLSSPVAAFATIRFSSIEQCGPFNVTFSGTQPTALPLTLTVVPFGSSATPLSIPLPDPEWDSKTSTGVAITFLPYPAGTVFIASLDDAQGRSTGFTSDIIKILPSGNTSCVSTEKKIRTYTAEPPFSQCQPFNVTFDPTQAVPPVARLFVPNGQAVLLNQTQEPSYPGTTSFIMAAFRGQPTVLLFSDGSGRLQSTDLLTVTGDVTSSNGCLPPPPDGGHPKGSQEVGLSRQAVIGIVASITGVVTLLSILILVYLFLQCRRRGKIHRTTQQIGIEGGPGFNGSGISPPLDRQSTRSSGNIINKPMPYPMEEYTGSPASPYFVQSISMNHALGRTQQMESLDAATADLDQILNASVFTPVDGIKPWSSTTSPSTPHSRDVQTSPQSTGTREQPKATIPMSPLSFVSNFRGSIIPASYVRAGVLEAELEAGGGNHRAAARRSSMMVDIPRQGVTDRGGRDGHGDHYL